MLLSSKQQQQQQQTPPPPPTPPPPRLHNLHQSGYMRTRVYYNPHTGTWTCTCVSVNAALGQVSKAEPLVTAAASILWAAIQPTERRRPKRQSP